MSNAYAGFELQAQIGGILHDVSRCEASFTLNEIPRGSVAVAVGRDQNFVTAAIHKNLKNMKLRQPVKVFLTVTDQFAAGLPSGTHVIFEGYATGIGYRRSTDSAEVVIGLEHWLGDLAHGSCISPSSSPRNPAGLIFDAVQPTDRTGIGDRVVEVEQIVSEIQEDFWGKALKPWLLELAKLDTLFDTSQAQQLELGEGAPQGNAAARKALERIEGTKYEFGVPLTMDNDVVGDLEQTIAPAIHMHLSHQRQATLANATFWDKILEFAADFMFAVVPMVDRALVVPLVPNLRGSWQDIFGTEYAQFDSRVDMPRLLRGLIVYGGKNFEALGAHNGEQSLPYAEFGVGGSFLPYKSGMVLYAAAPRWMADVQYGWEMPEKVGLDKVRANARAPRRGSKPTKFNPQKAAASQQTMLEAYARHLYGMEVLKFRQGSMSGKLRFDIGPGSIVAVDMVGDSFSVNSDELAEPIYACVIQSAFTLDAQNQQAGSSFQLSHLRAFSDADDPGLTAERHAIWTKTWLGSPLFKGA